MSERWLMTVAALAVMGCTDPFGEREATRRVRVTRRQECVLRMSMARTADDSARVLDWHYGSGWSTEYASCSFWLVADTTRYWEDR